MTDFKLGQAGDKSILYVMAAEPEYGVHLKGCITPLMTGIGPVEAAIVLTHTLAELQTGNALPDIVVSLGSAGSNTLQQTEIYQASTVSYRDMDASALGFEKGVTPLLDLPAELDLWAPIPNIPQARLSTGATIISGKAYAQIDADMVDMESFALARTCHRFTLPLIVLRGISDGKSDLNHLDDWTQYLHIIDEKLTVAVGKLETAIKHGLKL